MARNTKAAQRKAIYRHLAADNSPSTIQARAYRIAEYLLLSGEGTHVQ